MGADIEWRVGVIRAGRSYQGAAAAKAGGPMFEFSATVLIFDQTAEIMGATGAITPSIYREIETALAAAGVTHAIWDRVGTTARRVAVRNRLSASLPPADAPEGVIKR